MDCDCRRRTVRASSRPFRQEPLPLWASAHLDGGFDAHSRSQHAVARHTVQQDFHRHTLNHLHIIASRVFWRKYPEGLPRAALDGVDMTFYGLAAGVDLDGDMLSDTHEGELRFLEIRCDPNL